MLKDTNCMISKLTLFSCLGMLCFFNRYFHFSLMTQRFKSFLFPSLTIYLIILIHTSLIHQWNHHKNYLQNNFLKSKSRHHHHYIVVPGHVKYQNISVISRPVFHHLIKMDKAQPIPFVIICFF